MDGTMIGGNAIGLTVAHHSRWAYHNTHGAFNSRDLRRNAALFDRYRLLS